MFKKIFALSLCLCLCLSVAGCKKKVDTLSVDSGSVPAIPSEVKPVTYINPLTGEDGLTKTQALQRPVAIMINNISVAQPVQTGLNSADIIYETEVEGGITRLLAVFKDFKSVKKVGTIRSARYDFLDLALGHGAIYAHHGQDNYHVKPRLSQVDRIIVGTNNGGMRAANGLSLEHTLYAYGDKIWNSIKKSGIKTTLKAEETPWQAFSDETEPLIASQSSVSTSSDASVSTSSTAKPANLANSVNVKFSYSYTTTMKYNAETGRYTRLFNGTVRKDYNTKAAVTVKNVFVLNTTITNYPGCHDGKGHRKVNLTKGNGYYCVDGKYTKIKWSKGSANSPLKFTNLDGTPLVVTPGNSWVCISDSSRSKPTFS